jgi:taurine dioxygenase
MAAAYAALPQSVKDQIGGLKAIHDFVPTMARDVSDEQLEAWRKQYPPVTHPVVRTHPETGEKILFINEAFTTHLANFRKAIASEYRIGFDFRLAKSDLLQYLHRQAAAPEYQVRLRGKPDTIAIWDNRATQHYAVQDYFPAVRHMNRATSVPCEDRQNDEVSQHAARAIGQ